MKHSPTQYADPKHGFELIHADVEAALSNLMDRGQKLDLVISSPPYNIGKPYERGSRLTVDEYIAWQERIVSSCATMLNHTGSIVWQVGNLVNKGESIPIDILLYPIFIKHGFRLRNRIIWRFNFGLNADKRFSGRYETLLWFSKNDDYIFNLDPVRIPQIYPGKKHSASKGSKAGHLSGNPRGKNPSDYWEFSAETDFRDNPIWNIPNVKANHPEKTIHPCQFPIELAERCVLALSPENGTILDPFVGTGASAIAALKHSRRAIGIDREGNYLDIAKERLIKLHEGTLQVRPLGKPVASPPQSHSVARVPDSWQAMRAET